MNTSSLQPADLAQALVSPLRKSLQNTASFPVVESMPIDGKLFMRYPFGGRHCRNSGQPLPREPSRPFSGSVAKSMPTRTGSLHEVPPFVDFTNNCWQTADWPFAQ